VEGHPWEVLDAFNAGELVSDTRLQAAIYLNGYFWIAGGNSNAREPNLFYKVSRNGELIQTWQQFSTSNWGWRDLTTDGQYIYAVDSDFILVVDPNTGAACDTIKSDYIPNPTFAITYDPGNQWFWVSGTTTNILAFDRRGEYVRFVANQQRFRISGLMWNANDPDGYNLYVISNSLQREVEIRKVNVATAADTLVVNLGPTEIQSAGGGELTDEYLPFTTTAIIQMQGEQDWVQSYEVGSNFYWMNLTPTMASLDPSSSLQMELNLDPAGLEVGQTYTSHVQFDHNTPVEGALWLDISMSVLEARTVAEDATMPLLFGISAIYPNPFNPEATVSFNLDRSANVCLDVYDLSGRRMDSLLRGYMGAGSHCVQLRGAALPSGLYLVQLTDGSRRDLRKVTLMK